MNVAAVYTGPGVIWPTATASSNCCSDSSPSPYQVGLQERHQHVAAAEGEQADLEEQQEQRRQRDRTRTGDGGTDTAAGGRPPMKPRSANPAADLLAAACRPRAIASDATPPPTITNSRSTPSSTATTRPGADHPGRWSPKRGRRQPDDRHGHDRDDDGLDPVEQPAHRRRRAEPLVADRDRQDHQRGRADERDAGRQQAAGARAGLTDRERDLGATSDRAAGSRPRACRGTAARRSSRARARTAAGRARGAPTVRQIRAPQAGGTRGTPREPGDAPPERPRSFPRPGRRSRQSIVK